MRSRKRLALLIFWVAAQAVALSLLFTTPVYADDCLSDPLNGADCMRTGTFRQGISVIISMGGTIGVILINALSTWAATTASAGAAAATSAAAGAAATAGAATTTAATGAAASAAASGAVSAASAGPGPAATPAAPPGTPPATAESPGLYQQGEGLVAGLGENPWFGLIKNAAGPAATIAGSLSEFFTFPDAPAVVDAIRAAGNAWRNNPTKEAAEQYIKAIQGTRDLRLANLAGVLDTGSKVVDVVDAVSSGLTRANERGFTGVDKALTIGAEIGKKGLTWMLTKNPVVGLVDSAVGGATEMVWGKDGRIDIGGTVDKGANAWDKTTQEYFNNTQGASDADANLQTQDQFLHLIRRVKEQFNQGQLTREQASQRMRHLRDTMFGGQP
jgi:hypothetical protein